MASPSIKDIITQHIIKTIQYRNIQIKHNNNNILSLHFFIQSLSQVLQFLMSDYKKEAKYILASLYYQYLYSFFQRQACMYYTVEDILDKKIVKGKIWYKVKWLGYGEEDSTWQPPYTLEFAKQLIYDFQEAEGNQVNSKIFEDRDYGITQQDFYHDNHPKSSRRKKKNGNKLQQGKPCVEFEDIITPSSQSAAPTVFVKKQICKAEQSSDYGDNYGEENSSFSYNRYWPSNSSESSPNIPVKKQIKIISKKGGRAQGDDRLYIVETGTRQLTEMTSTQLLQEYPVQFAKFLQEALYFKQRKN